MWNLGAFRWSRRLASGQVEPSAKLKRFQESELKQQSSTTEPPSHTSELGKSKEILSYVPLRMGGSAMAGQGRDKATSIINTPDNLPTSKLGD